MPHSTKASDDSRSIYSDRTVTSQPLTVLEREGKPTPRPRPQSQHPSGQPRGTLREPTWHKRRSLPIADAYAHLIAKGEFTEEAFSLMAGDRSSVSLNGDSKRRTQYYEEQFQYKDSAMGSARERVQREAPVVAELRTNVIIKDEFTLVTDLSYHLAARFARPDSSIMINVDHSSCLALAGTFEPCYMLTITTVPSQMQPATNKRNAALIQSFMADILSVPPDRGIIKFSPIPEENYAMNGNTMLGEIERLERQTGGDAVKRANTDARKSMPSYTKRGITDADVNNLKDLGRSNGVTSPTTKAERRRSKSASPHPTSAIPNVFELAGTQRDDDRPATSSGPGSGSYPALNGLRLNGVSKEELVGANSKTPGGRPKTIAGRPTADRNDSDRSLNGKAAEAGAPAPSVSRSSTNKTEARKSNVPISPKPAVTDYSRRNSAAATPSAPKAPAVSTMPPTIKNAYLDNVTAKTPASDKKTDAKYDERQNDKDPAANTAKRRSTITATPKIPGGGGSNNGVGPPPPVPESKTPKVSKRKSFLSAFRR